MSHLWLTPTVPLLSPKVNCHGTVGVSRYDTSRLFFRCKFSSSWFSCTFPGSRLDQSPIDSHEASHSPWWVVSCGFNCLSLFTPTWNYEYYDPTWLSYCSGWNKMKPPTGVSAEKPPTELVISPIHSKLTKLTSQMSLGDVRKILDGFLQWSDVHIN